MLFYAMSRLRYDNLFIRIIRYDTIPRSVELSRNIRQSRLRQSSDELCTSFIPLQHLCPIGRHFTMLDFRLFPIDVTNSVEISIKIRDPSSRIHHLLPLACDPDLTSRLRRAFIYPRPCNRTNCYKSFIHHAVLKFQ